MTPTRPRMLRPRAGAQCIAIANRAVITGDLEKADKFARKAHGMFPSQQASAATCMRHWRGCRPCMYVGEGSLWSKIYMRACNLRRGQRIVSLQPVQGFPG
eukprot:283396-Chlamydomonas_euryale.AAC.6